MTLGKKERMIAVIVVIAGLAAAIHFLIFAKKAKTYEQTRQEYADAQTKLGSAEFIVAGANDQTQAFAEFEQKTTQYESLVTSVVSELNLQKVDMGTSPPVGALDQWASGTIELLNQLNAQRNGRVKLTFLDQSGWNFTPQLPSAGAVGALADRVSQLVQIYPQLHFATDPMQQAQLRNNYNSRLQAVGVPPEETSYFFYPQMRLFFNDIKWLESAMRGTAGQSTLTNMTPYYNPYGLQRFGTAVPGLKKIWVYNLISQELQRQNSVNPQVMLGLGEALEVGIPLEASGPLDSINKQLKALLDIIGIAERTGVTEILSVKLQRPINVAKATLFVPGATPPPAATPAVATPMAGMDPMMMDETMMMDFGGGGAALNTKEPLVTPVPDAEAVGTAAGVELDIRGDNTSLTRFYFEISHLNRSYGIDDLYYFTEQGGGLRTTSTIEIITDVKLGQPAMSEVVQ